MSGAASEILMLCYGNPARLDDSLGPAFAEAIREDLPPTVRVDVDYQLNVEDAAMMAEHEIAIFVDASVQGPAPFFFEKLEPSAEISFTSHSISPSALLELTERVFGVCISGYAMGIRGYSFDDFGEKLSSGARENLERAVEFVKGLLKTRDFGRAAENYRRMTERVC